MRYRFGGGGGRGLYLEELIHGGDYFRNFTVYLCCKVASFLKTSKVTAPNNLFQMKRNLACKYIRLSSLLARLGRFVGETPAPQRQK